MRLVNWEQKLTDYIELKQNQKFKWGKNDCALFAADCVKQITGIDYATEFRDKYKTEQGAREALKKYGKGTLLKTIDSKFTRYSSALLAQRGDIVYFQKALGVCIGKNCCFYDKHGMVFVPIINMEKAWKVI